MNRRSFWVQRPLVCLAAAYGAGLWLGLRGLAVLQPAALTGLVAACLLLAVLRLGRRPLALGLCGLFFFGGACLGMLASRPVTVRAGKALVTGKISGPVHVRERDGRVQAVLRPATVMYADGSAVTLPAAYWTSYPDKERPALWDGQTARFTGTVYAPKGQQNPFGFDFALYLRQRGITAGISGARGLDLSPQTAHADPWLRARLAVNARLDALFGPYSALPKALLTGDRQDIEEETADAFRLAGVAHVLAVSGLHIGLLMGMLQFLLKKFSFGPMLRLAIVAVVLAFYCRFLGFQDSVVRAAVMTMILLLGQTLRRRRDTLTALAAAFMLILVFKPLEMLNAGFQLSFLAVAGIVVSGDAMQALWRGLSPRGPRFLHQMISALVASWAAWLWTLGVLANTFHFISPAALLYSPAAVALLMVLMVSYIGVTGLSLVSMPLAGTAAALPAWLTRIFADMTQAVAEVPGAYIRFPHIPVWWLLFLYAAFFLLSRYCLLPRKHRALIAALGFCFCIGLDARTLDRAVRYTQLSLGNADSAVIEDGGATFVVDAGEYGGDLAAYLLAGGRTVDTLFLTHAHQDHTGGLEQLLEHRVPIREIALPDVPPAAEGRLAQLLDKARQRGTAVRYLAAGDMGASARTRYRVLWPHRGRVREGLPENDRSLSLWWDLDGLTLLSSGDLTARYEGYTALPAQVLKAAHHGAKGAADAEFIRAVSPDIVIASDDGAQRARSLDGRARDAVVLHTADTGALTLTATQEGVSIRRFLNDKGADHEGR